MRHLGANFYSQFKNKKLMKLFKRLCSQNQERKFKALWRKLDELTRKQTEQLSKRPVTDDVEVPVALAEIPLDPHGLRRKDGPSIKTFSEWIEHEDKEKWALLYDEGGLGTVS